MGSLIISLKSIKVEIDFSAEITPKISFCYNLSLVTLYKNLGSSVVKGRFFDSFL